MSSQSLPRTRNLNRLIVYIVYGACLGLVLTGWWQGNATAIFEGSGLRLIALAKLFGLLAALGSLLQITLMSRLPIIERNFDLHQYVTIHRFNGYWVVATISAHVACMVLGYGLFTDLNPIQQYFELTRGAIWILLGSLAASLIFGAAAISIKLVRSRLRYELWYFVHLFMYIAILLAFLHQINAGSDLQNGGWLQTFWYVLYLIVFGLMLYYRALRMLLRFRRHKFRVALIEQETPTIYSVYITGVDIAKFEFEPGQYASWRFLTASTWYQAHPFSISSLPGAEELRLSFRSTSGNFCQKLPSVSPGTAVIIDGPRGAFTHKRCQTEAAVLVAGGIGITPFIGIIPTLLQAGKPVTLLYAVRNVQDIAFSLELQELERQGLKLQTFPSDQGQRITKDVLRAYIQSDATFYVCGPASMTQSLTANLAGLKVPSSRIITEYFSI